VNTTGKIVKLYALHSVWTWLDINCPIGNYFWDRKKIQFQAKCIIRLYKKKYNTFLVIGNTYAESLCTWTIDTISFNSSVIMDFLFCNYPESYVHKYDSDTQQWDLLQYYPKKKCDEGDISTYNCIFSKRGNGNVLELIISRIWVSLATGSVNLQSSQSKLNFSNDIMYTWTIPLLIKIGMKKILFMTVIFCKMPN